MMISPETAVERLTRPWSDVLSPDETGLDKYLPVDYPPLLDMLNDACRNSVGESGGGAGGDPATRSLLNLEAHQLREKIDGSVRAWVSRLGKGKCEPELSAAVVQLAGMLQAHHAAKSIPETEYARIRSFFGRWCEQVWKIYEPPTVKELVGQCPNPDCNASKYKDAAGDVGAALIAFYVRDSSAVTAKCRACSWEWRDGQLRLLGAWLGAEQDDEFLDAVGL